MYKFYSRPKKRVSKRWTIFAAAATSFALMSIFSPSESERMDYRTFPTGLKVSLHRGSPPFAALEDELLEQLEMMVSPVPVGPSLPLLAGETRLMPILTAARAVENAIATELIAPVSVVSTRLDELKIDRQKLVLDLLWSGREPTAQVADVKTRLRNQNSGVGFVAAQNDMRPIDTAISNDLSLELEPLAPEDEGSIRIIGGRIIPPRKPAASTEPIVASNSSRRTAQGPTPARGPSFATEEEQARSPHRGRPGASSGAAGLVGENAHPSNARVASITPDRPSSLNQLVIGGHVEVTNGLALTDPNDQIVIFREYEGRTREAGQVWLRDGRYEIFVNEPQGRLIGELRTPQGEILGRGSFDLAALPPIEATQYKVQDINLTLKPIVRGLSGRVASAYSFADRIYPVAEAQVEMKEFQRKMRAVKDGHFEDTQVLEGSSFQLTVEHKDYWPTTMMATTGETLPITLYPQKMLNAFLNISANLNTSTIGDRAIIWGRALVDGRPVAGARVELMTTEADLRPIYFDALQIPSERLNGTSENGWFAFAGVPAGVHAVRTYFRGRHSEMRLFSVGERQVATVDVETTQTRRSDIKVFDAFQPEKPLSAQIGFVGAEESHAEVGSSGEGVFTFSKGRDVMFVDADAGGDYRVTRLSVNRDQDFFAVPMIQSGWINTIHGPGLPSQNDKAGLIVGFIQGNSQFAVYMDETIEYDPAHIVYFDEFGKVTNEKYGRPGGGFILLNVPEGMRTISVLGSGSRKLLTSVQLVDADVVNVFSHSFR